MRALYTNGRWGPLSNQVYFATLPPVEVHVSRISESFVHVRWERLPQERVTNKLRTQYRQQQVGSELLALSYFLANIALPRGHLPACLADAGCWSGRKYIAADLMIFLLCLTVPLQQARQFFCHPNAVITASLCLSFTSGGGVLRHPPRVIRF